MVNGKWAKSAQWFGGHLGRALGYVSFSWPGVAVTATQSQFPATLYSLFFFFVHSFSVGLC